MSIFRTSRFGLTRFVAGPTGFEHGHVRSAIEHQGDGPRDFPRYSRPAVRMMFFQENKMRTITMLSVLLPILVASQPGQAKEPPTEITLSSGDALMTEGIARGGDAQVYLLKIAAAQSITFNVNADNQACSYQVKKTSRLGFLPDRGSFPTSYTDAAKEGELYTISFSQTLTARMAEKNCNFSFSIK